MKNPKAFHKMLFSFILITLVGALLGTIFYWRSLDNLSKKISEKEITIENFVEKERALDNLSRNYTSVKNIINEIDYAIPTEKEAASLLSSIETLATSKELSVYSYEHKADEDKKKKKKTTITEEFGESTGTSESNSAIGAMFQVEKDGDLMRINPEITVTGSYTKVQEFVDEIEDLNRLLLVNKVDILKEADATATDFVRATVGIYTYFKR